MVSVQLDSNSTDVKTLLEKYPLSNGDIMEIRNDNKAGSNVSATVTYIDQNGLSNFSAGGLGEFQFGDVKERVYPGMSVYRLVSSEQLKSAGSCFNQKDWHSGKYARKNELEADLVAVGTDSVSLTLKDSNSGKSVSVKRSIEDEWLRFDDSDSYSTIRSRFETSLGKTGGTPFDISQIRFHGKFDFTIPVSVINSMRREAVSEIENALCIRRELPFDSMTNTESEPEDIIKEKDEYSNDYSIDVNLSVDSENSYYEQRYNKENNKGKVEFELFFYDIETFAKYYLGGEKNPIEFICRGNVATAKYLIPAAEFLLYSTECAEDTKDIANLDEADAERIELRKKILDIVRERKGDIYLYVTNVARGREREIIATRIQELASICRENEMKIYLGNVSQIELFKVIMNSGIDFRADYGMNIYNEEAAELCRTLGMSDYIESLEVDGVHYGAIPLMTIGHENEAASIIDRKGVEYKLLKQEYMDNIILVKEMNNNPRRELADAINLVGSDRRRRRFYITKPVFD